MRRADDDADQMIGQDSFLDVVTNIVGILILLVMVVGMRTSHAVETATRAKREADPTRQVSDDELRTAYESAANGEREVSELVRRAVDIRQETQLREHERMLLNTVVAEAEQEIQARRSELNDQDRRDFDVRRQLNDAQMSLDELTREQVALLSEDADVEEIECQPTPLARAVNGKEVHLLLSDDHVAIVPFDELLEQMKIDAKDNIWRLRQQDELERAVGPINGFRLRYWFVKSGVIARTETGSVVASQFASLARCICVPDTTPAGEPAAESLRPDSEVHQLLKRQNPQSTTVTIWTYPGNYDRLREIKRAIRELGFQIALRPLPTGTPIGASPGGTRSVSE